MDVNLTVRTRLGVKRIALSGDRLTVGRGEEAGLSIVDRGLSRLHASINCDGRRVWILDEGSTNGSLVNGEPVSETGRLLVDGDEIELGDETTIVVCIAEVDESGSENSDDRRLSSPATGVLLLLVSLSALVLIAVTLLSKSDFRRAGSGPAAEPVGLAATGKDVVTSALTADAPPRDQAERETSAISGGTLVAGDQFLVRLYREMTNEERLVFVDREAQRITTLISNDPRPEVFEDFVIQQIKKEVDAYAAARGRSGLWGVSADVIFRRAIKYAPYISRCFNQEGVPNTIGLYIVWIETAYQNLNYENHAHAMGLFQFIPATAIEYGIDPDQRTNVEKMAPAAARYMRYRIARFGDDTKGVALAIANYNRGGTPEDLRKTIDRENPDRSFWTLMANREKLDHYFQKENVNYVPRFFAAAIIGENPRVFGVRMNPLSSYSMELRQP